MLKKRELHEAPVLFDLSMHPEVFPFIRHKVTSIDAFYFLTKQTIEKEAQGELISRTILDEYEQPIGTINLFDIKNKAGFLATWLGRPYFGQGYNQMAKTAFFEELFFNLDIETIFIKIRTTNIRSFKAMQKLEYAFLANEIYPEVYEQINQGEYDYHLFAMTKAHYETYLQFAQVQVDEESEVVS